MKTQHIVVVAESVAQIVIEAITTVFPYKETEKKGRVNTSLSTVTRGGLTIISHEGAVQAPIVEQMRKLAAGVEYALLGEITDTPDTG